MMRFSPASTYIHLFEQSVRRFPDHVALRLKTPDGYRDTTYAEVWHQAKGVALGLAGMGLRPETRIAILSENRPEWVFAYLGIFLSGCTAVPLDPLISPAEWRRLLDDSESELVFVSSHLMSKLRAAVHGGSFLKKLICFDPVAEDDEPPADLHRFVEWGFSLEPSPVLSEGRPSNWAVLIYTSGTTGQPKGVMLTQQNIVAEMAGIFDVVTDLSENESLLCMLPLQHVLSSIINLLTPLAIGAQAIFIDTLKRSEILAALEDAGVTILLAVPQFFYLFYDQIQDELGKQPFGVRMLFHRMHAMNRISRRLLRINLGKIFFGKIHRRFGSKLRYFVCGGSAFDPKVIRFFFDLGFTVVQGYGLTETTGAICATPLNDNVPGSVGKAMTGCEVQLHETNEAGVGEVVVRGPMVMKGYYRNPQATAEVLRDGWLYSGDLGRLDASGHLWITGRSKEVIVLPNGKNIYPDEIEAHYQQCSYIKEIAVLGIRASGHETSEKLHAVVVPDFDAMKARKIANAREILREEIGRLSGLLPKYKRLMSYQIQKEPLPRTTTRKIRRLELKRLIERGELCGMEPGAAVGQIRGEEAAELRESAVGQEVLRCLREDYRRDPVDPDMNLELDLGFDSMERVELLASLEKSLNLRLPEDFGAEIFTVRELITRLDPQTVAAGGAGSAARQSWATILSQEALSTEGEWHVKFTGAFLTTLKYIGLRFIYLICRVVCRMEIQGLKNLPRSGPFLICPNHLSYIDPFVVLCVVPYRVFRKVFFVGASEYFQTWYMKLLGKLANIVPVDPDAHLLRAMKVGAYGLHLGRVLCIFPEGARSFDGEIKEFKKGAAILSRELQAPIVPVAIDGAFEVWPRDSLRIRPHRLQLAFGAPFIPGDAGGKDPYQAGTDQLKEKVIRLLHGLER